MGSKEHDFLLEFDLPEFLLQIYLNLPEIAHMSNHQGGGGVTPPTPPGRYGPETILLLNNNIHENIMQTLLKTPKCLGFFYYIYLLEIAVSYWLSLLLFHIFKPIRKAK
jgi:hypothetical protein